LPGQAAIGVTSPHGEKRATFQEIDPRLESGTPMPGPEGMRASSITKKGEAIRPRIIVSPTHQLALLMRCKPNKPMPHGQGRASLFDTRILRCDHERISGHDLIVLACISTCSRSRAWMQTCKAGEQNARGEKKRLILRCEIPAVTGKRKNLKRRCLCTLTCLLRATIDLDGCRHTVSGGEVHGLRGRN
jgi:hypothetical protein